jgi:hypothetical protein
MLIKRPYLFTSIACLTILLMGCVSTPQIEIIPTSSKTEVPILDHTTTFTAIIPSTTLGTDTPEVPIVFALTNQRLDGNRFVSGQGRLPYASPIDIDLPGKPVWIVGTPHENGIIWTVVLEEGKVVSYFSNEIEVSETSFDPSQLPPGMPPLMRSSSGGYSLVSVSDPAQSPFTHPNYLPQSNIHVYLNQNGDLEFIDPSNQHLATLKVNGLPDARILVDQQERLLLLSDPTNKYNHGVLGDNLEASSITLIDTQPTPQITSVITLPDNEVIEGIAPIWVDLDKDGDGEIVVTVSDLELGAGLVVFSEIGERLAEGPKMGRPFRWRHQIAFGELGPEGESELAVVRTPHIGGVVEYYKYTNGNLSVVAEFPGITSHTIGSRNLDMAAAGDFDGDGAIELLLPNPNLTDLVAVRRTPSGVEDAWRIPIGGVMSTNLAGVTLPNGKLAVAVGREDRVLTLWFPE